MTTMAVFLRLECFSQDMISCEQRHQAFKKESVRFQNHKCVIFFKRFVELFFFKMLLIKFLKHLYDVINGRV